MLHRKNTYLGLVLKATLLVKAWQIDTTVTKSNHYEHVIGVPKTFYNFVLMFAVWKCADFVFFS